MTGDSLDQPIRRNPHAATRMFDEEAFIVVPQSHEYKILNSVGSRVWELIDGSRTMKDIVDIIAAEYEVSREEAGRDVQQFVDDLKANGMLAPAGAGKVA